MTKIPLVALARPNEATRAVEEALLRVARSGAYASGKELPAFEEEWAAYCGTSYCVGLSSCSDALFLSLLWFKGTRQIERVLTTPVSFWATTESAIRAGLDVRFTDIHSDGNISPYLGEMDRRDLLLPVHLYGQPLRPMARDGALEDCAQAHGIKWQPGSLAQCFSFYPTKNLGALGMAGAVVTDDFEMVKWLRHMRSHGEVEGHRFVHASASGNWRMDELQAAVLRAKLPHLDAWTARRRELAERYSEGLRGVPGIITPWGQGTPSHVWHIYNLRLASGDRDEVTRLGAWLLQHGNIETGRRYPYPLHLQPYFQRRGEYLEGAFPEAEKWCASSLNLPIYPELGDWEVDRVISVIREGIKGLA